MLPYFNVIGVSGAGGCVDAQIENGATVTVPEARNWDFRRLGLYFLTTLIFVSAGCSMMLPLARYWGQFITPESSVVILTWRNRIHFSRCESNAADISSNIESADEK